MSAKEDLEIGRGLLASFIPFIQRLIDERLAKKTIKTHARNLNILGHEIVERFNQNDKDKRDASPRELILHFVDDEGGPLLSFWDPSDITDYRRHPAVAKFSRHFGRTPARLGMEECARADSDEAGHLFRANSPAASPTFNGLGANSRIAGSLNARSGPGGPIEKNVGALGSGRCT